MTGYNLGYEEQLILPGAEHYECAGFEYVYALFGGEAFQFFVFGARVEDDAFGF